MKIENNIMKQKTSSLIAICVYRCIEESQMITGRFPIQCYSTKEKIRKQEFNADCCDTDFCNDNIILPPGTKFLNTQKQQFYLNSFKWQWLHFCLYLFSCFDWSPFRISFWHFCLFATDWWCRRRGAFLHIDWRTTIDKISFFLICRLRK